MNWTLAPAADRAARAAFAARWQALHAAAGASLLLSWDFVAPLLDEFGAGNELLAWCERDGRTVALTIAVPAGRGAWATFQPAQAPLGLWLQAPALPLEPLLQGLLQALPGLPLAFSLMQMDPWLMPRPADASRTGTLDYIATAHVDIVSGFDAYWQARGKNLRNNLKKQRNRLEREGVAARLEVIEAPEAMAGAVADYGRLEQSGWKAGQGTAVGADDAQGRYYRAMLEAFARRGHGRVYRYWLGDRLAAMDLCIDDGDTLVVLKTSYDEAAAANLSPTLLMREEAMRRLFEDGRLRRIEFYGRVMGWHLRWTEQVRTMYHVNYYRWPALRRLHAFARARAQAQASDVPATEQ
jgi:CelD/BcsL family acetyltransferase involved in cellulose biosynthesis